LRQHARADVDAATRRAADGDGDRLALEIAVRTLRLRQASASERHDDGELK
jgi:hypothetical protein